MNSTHEMCRQKTLYEGTHREHHEDKERWPPQVLRHRTESALGADIDAAGPETDIALNAHQWTRLLNDNMSLKSKANHVSPIHAPMQSVVRFSRVVLC